VAKVSPAPVADKALGWFPMSPAISDPMCEIAHAGTLAGAALLQRRVMLLEDRVIVVTGAAGIAAACAKVFAAEGATIHVISVVETECAELVEKLGGAASFYVADLSDEESAERGFAACLGRHGRIDGLFAAAGASGRPFGDGRIEHISLDAWNQTLAANLTPAFLSAREAIRVMLGAGRGGSIVLVGSVLAAHPSHYFETHAYAAAKGGVVSLCRTAASAHAGDGIRVNVLAPGLVRTAMSQRAADDPVIVAYSEAKQPLASGFIEPYDIAGTGLFLLSDLAARVTGQVIEVDAGWGVMESGPRPS